MARNSVPLFFSLVLPKAQAEFYGEYGRNDHAADLRDFLLEPEHARAYVLGFRKLFKQNNHRHLELMAEVCTVQKTSTALLRAQESYYSSSMVLHGYTNLGKIMGAGVGPRGSSQTLGLGWINGLNKTGLYLERWVHNNDFFYAFAQPEWWTEHWADVSFNAYKTWARRHFLYKAEAGWIYSFNYEWTCHQDRNNLHAVLSVSYLF